MFKEIIEKLNKAEKVGIFTHVNPDGDAMGSSYSLKQVLLAMGKKAEVFLSEHPDASAKKLILCQEETNLKIEDCDLLVALDCADSKRLGEYMDLFLSHTNTIALDHHITHQPFAKSWVMQDISSTCELMERVYREMDITVTTEIANNLYVGLVSDTGNFKYSCVSSETFLAAARLIETGVDFAHISKKIFDTKSRQYYELMQTSIERLEFFQEGRVCILYLSQEDFRSKGIEEFEAPGIVNIPSSIEGVAVGVFIRGRDNKEFKISLRSSKDIDVALIAKNLGGGGHTRAAGYSAFDTTVQDIKERVLVEINKQL